MKVSHPSKLNFSFTSSCYSFLLLLFGTISLFISCADTLEKSKFEPFLKESTHADEAKLSSIQDSIFIRLKYKNAPDLGSDFLTSITALSYIDTAKAIIFKQHIRFIKVELTTPHGVEMYSYPLDILEKAKQGLETSSLFLRNMLSGNGQANSDIVDPKKITLEDLEGLNTINEQIQTSMKIDNLTFDGFISQLDDMDVIEIRAKLLSKNEALPVVLQYHLQSKKIFYFGINE